MTEHQTSNNPDASGLSSPQQTSNSDLSASEISKVLTEIADASRRIANALDEANKKPKTDTIAKLSLFISFLTIVSTIALGTLGALFLYNKQAETNIKFSLAQLTLDAPPTITCPNKVMRSCLAELQVTNKGPAAATGVTIDVFMKDIGPTWRTSLNDMNNFTIITLPSIVKVQKVSCMISTPLP